MSIEELKKDELDYNVSKYIGQCMGLIGDMMLDIATLKLQVSALQEEIEDQKEAFEHADDSLQSLRTTVSAIKHQ